MEAESRSAVAGGMCVGGAGGRNGELLLMDMRIFLE